MRWSLPARFEFAQDLRLIQVTFQEIRRAANFYPLCLRQTGNILDLVAILADEQGKNIHIDAAGKWATEYLPLMLRVHPFSLVRRAGGDDLLLAVTHDGGLFGKDGEHDLFDEHGKFSPATSIVLAALQTAETQRPALRTACELLATLDITVPVPSGALNGGLHRQKLFVIDPEKLAALSATQRARYVELYRSNPFALHLVEAIVYSQNNFAFRSLLADMPHGERLKQVHPSITPEPTPDDTPPAEIDENTFIDYGATLDFGS